MQAQLAETAAVAAGARAEDVTPAPPFGYRLVDAGPHPNRAHADWGRRRQRLDPDPVSARHVPWIFAERLAGRSVAGIARELDERRVLCPSAADPGRNRHRGGLAWNLRSVAVILANPRYTGREVWRRHQCATPGGGRRVIPAEWAISPELAHPALVCEADFVAVQQIRAARMTDDGVIRRAGYRCRHGDDCASQASGVVAHLRSRDMVIVHDRTGRRVAARR